MRNGQDFGEFELLRVLTEASGVPGREERIRELVLRETRGMWDETRVDNMGNLICLKRASRAAPPAAKSRTSGAQRGEAKVARRGRSGRLETGRTGDRLETGPTSQTGSTSQSGPTGQSRPTRVMIACHMDEIGFYVRYIDEAGHLRLQNVGGFDTRNLFARRVLVQGRRDLVGVLNPVGRPIHLATEEDKKKIPEIKDFYIDLFMPREEVIKLVEIGDPVTLIQQTEMIGDAVCGKAMDNRVALWVGINAVRKAARSPYDIYFVACVQEEVGLRGAQTAAYSVDPDIGIAIDTTLCCDTPGITKDDAVTEFGKGVGIKVMDSASISDRSLFEEFVAIARKKRITHQLEVLPRGGTDAGALQRSRGGTRAITLSVPTRYIHTITEAIHKNDAKATVDLLAAWLVA